MLRSPIKYREHPERNALGLKQEIIDEMRVQSKGRSMTLVAPATIERPFDCTRRPTLVNILGLTRVPLSGVEGSGCSVFSWGCVTSVSKLVLKSNSHISKRQFPKLVHHQRKVIESPRHFRERENPDLPSPNALALCLDSRVRGNDGLDS